jgi:hypothetical protein
MGAGRPLKFPDVNELQERIDSYFEDCDDYKKPYTVCGLAYSLDVSRETLLNYEKKEKYFGTITRAKQRIQTYAEEFLYTAKSAHGVMFSLKNNFGWVDRKEVQADVNVKGELDIRLNEAKRRLRDNDEL